MTADKKDNYLNGYCTGQTDLLQAMIDQAPAAYMYDQARYGPTDLRGQQWLPELSRLKPYEGNGMVRDVTPLYTTPPQRKPLTDEQKDILNFLFGLRAIDDVWFGDKHPTERGQYWWRNRLRKAFQEAAHSIKEKNT